MTEADPDTSELVDLKHVSAPFFSIPGLFSAKGDSDAGRSPTSPLDFSVFANFGGLFSPRSSSSPRFSHRNKWGCDKVGLSVLSSSLGDGHNDPFRRENIVLAPQIKFKHIGTEAKSFLPYVKANSLPKDYAASASFSDVRDTNSVEEHTLTPPKRSSSSPVDIISSQIYARSLSGREMALSEDYTCIISHGPNPKTTHIFGDCILDCDPKELGTKEEIEIQETNLLPRKSLDDTVNQLCLCTGKPQDCHSSDMDSREVAGEKADVEEDSLEISPGSSYNGDLFPMAMPLCFVTVFVICNIFFCLLL